MITIGICEDEEKEFSEIRQMCQNFFQKSGIEGEICVFSSGESLLQYCEEEDKVLDLLFLDIELEGISGIEVKERLSKDSHVWRILFISNHPEAMREAFGIKTMGFLEKPVSEEELFRWLSAVCKEKEEAILEDISYIQADGHYTRVYFQNMQTENGEEQYMYVPATMSDWEEKFEEMPIVRTHRSYMVNLENVLSIKRGVLLRNSEKIIPVGRKYRENLQRAYQEFIKTKVRNRIFEDDVVHAKNVSFVKK